MTHDSHTRDVCDVTAYFEVIVLLTIISFDRNDISDIRNDVTLDLCVN